MTEDRRSKAPRNQGLLAESEETIAVVPLVAGAVPVEVQAPLGHVLVEIRHVAVTRVHPAGAEGHDGELALQLGVPRTEGEQVLDLRGHESLVRQALLDVLGRDALAEVHEHQIDWNLTTALDLEVLGRDLVVLPVILAPLDHLDEVETVVDEHRELRAEELVGLLEETLEVLAGDETLFDEPEKMADLTVRRGVHGLGGHEFLLAC